MLNYSLHWHQSTRYKRLETFTSTRLSSNCCFLINREQNIVYSYEFPKGDWFFFFFFKKKGPPEAEIRHKKQVQTWIIFYYLIDPATFRARKWNYSGGLNDVTTRVFIYVSTFTGLQQCNFSRNHSTWRKLSPSEFVYIHLHKPSNIYF